MDIRKFKNANGILELYGSGCEMILFKQDEIVRFFA